MPNIKIISGSTRPNRFNPQPAGWIHRLALQRADMQVELIDLAELDLPILDEPNPASQQNYTKQHTKDWSATIAEADGFIFVTPEYNHSYSAALKNAIDYLFVEWHHKPVSFISYGSLAGGSRAVEHLRGVAAEIKMYDLREQLMFPNYWNDLNEQGEYQFTEQHEEAAAQLLDSLVFWAGEMKESRAKLNS